MLIHNLAPACAVVFAVLLIKEKPSLNHLIAIMTGFLGLIVLLGINVVDPGPLALGTLLSLIAAISSGLQDVIQRKLSKTAPGINQAFVFILGQAMGSIVFLNPQQLDQLNWFHFGEIVYFGLIGTALPIILLSQSFKHLKSFEVATLGYTEPLLGAF